MSTLKVVSALLLGAAAGAAVAILFAPDKGSVTRKNIKDSAKGMADKILGKAEEILDIAEKQSRTAEAR